MRTQLHVAWIALVMATATTMVWLGDLYAKGHGAPGGGVERRVTTGLTVTRIEGPRVWTSERRWQLVVSEVAASPGVGVLMIEEVKP